MALGFGKKKQDGAPDAAGNDEIQFSSDANAGTDFDSDTINLESFASDLESAGSSGNIAKNKPANDDPLAWDDTALINFDDQDSFGATPSNQRPGARGGHGEATPFDDLARELEEFRDIPGQYVPPAAGAAGAAAGAAGIGAGLAAGATPERRERRRPVSADLGAAIAESTGPEATGGKKKKEKKEKSKPIVVEGEGGKKKLPLVPIVIVVGLLAAAGGGAFMLMGGSQEEEPPAPPPATEQTAPPPADAAKPPAPAQPATEEVSPETLNRLKTLWKQGAAAKNKGDNAGARAAWQEMLKIRPNHPGVQEAIDKLPKG